MNIKEMKAARDLLHIELSEYLAQVKPKEAEIRSKIKVLQDDLYKREMLPVAQKLKHSIDEGLLEGQALVDGKAKLATIGFLLEQ